MSLRIYGALIGCLAACLINIAHADIAMQNPDSRIAINLDGRWDTIIDPYENGFYNHRYEESGNGYFKNAKPANPSDLVEYDFARSPKLNVPG
ncbi:MAG TPA: hypothetical protein PK002_16270, partial [Cellvibrio sp.]|nr:hypothetical protein [Cellvibrio sp.]